MQPAKIVRGELWYCSPFRPETVPSFKINPERNVWYDFGEGEGGNVLDFVMKYHKVGSISEALEHLVAFDQPRFPSFAPPGSKPATAPNSNPFERPVPPTQPTVIIKALAHPALTTYLARRGIPLGLACRYVEEIHYTRAGKAYFALAFQNTRGGYELRNPSFKGTHGPKDITLLNHSATRLQTWAVFEGFIDFLSAQVAGLLAHPEPSVLVLNSTALKDTAFATIRASGATRVELYLDHDPSGRALTAFFRHQLAGVEIVDRSDLYAGHKDVNEFLTAGKRAAHD